MQSTMRQTALLAACLLTVFPVCAQPVYAQPVYAQPLYAQLVYAQSASAQLLPEPSTYGRTPTPELVLLWLHAPDPRLQAWAARDALLASDADLVPELQAQLERTTRATLNAAGRLANFRTTLALLDTLIQLNATVPAPTLERLESLGYNAQTEEIILLSRLPAEQAEPMMHMFYRAGPAGGNPAATRVAAQWLVHHPSKDFAAEVLASILVTANITVHDTNSFTGIGLGASSCCGAGSGPTTNDWPEIGRYAFQDPPPHGQPLAANETLFFSAPDPVYVLRAVGHEYYAMPRCGSFLPLNDAIRSHLAGTLLGGSPVSPFPEKPVTLNLLFQSREEYRAQVQAFVDEQQENFKRVAASLVSRNLLTEEQRQAATLHIDLSLQDLRLRPGEDLPAIVFRPPVQWVPAF